MSVETTDTEPTVKEELPVYMKNSRSIDHQYIGLSFLHYMKSIESKIYTMSDTKEIYFYKDGIYMDGAKDLINEYVSNMCGEDCTIHGQKEVINFITYKTLINRREFNKNDCKLNLSNGVYNYHTGEFKPHSVDNLYTTKFNVAYAPEAKCLTIDKFLNQVLDEEDILLVLEAFAYCFVPNYRIQNYFLFYGGGNQGKGTTLSILSSLLGKSNITSVSLQDLNNDRNYTQARLYGKKANICGDMSKKSLRNTDFIKKATGGDSITVRNIRKEPFDMVNTAKFLFSVNEVPEILDDSDGFYRRIIPIVFDKKISKIDRDIIDKLTTEEEKSGLFNKLMEALPNLLERGKFSFNKDINSIRDMMDVHSDPISSFLSQCTTDGRDKKALKSSFYKEYVEWCRINRITPLSNIVLGKRLKGKNYQYKMSDCRITFFGKQELCWNNIELITNFRKEEPPKETSFIPKLKI